LTGIAFMARVLQDRLAESSLPESAEAAKIVALVNESIRMTRELARGLLPVAPKGRGLVPALKLWANEICELFQVDCRVECPRPVLLHGEAFAEHLYRLAQEAVTNAIRHGRARIIVIELALVEQGGALTIQDDGCGFDLAAANRSGLGMRTMDDRARVIGGSLNVQSAPNGGTIVRCLFPIPDSVPEETGGD
jgi:signal transduction histidine kinase